MLSMLAHTGEKARDIYMQPWRRLANEAYTPIAALRWLQQRQLGFEHDIPVLLRWQQRLVRAADFAA